MVFTRRYRYRFGDIDHAGIAYYPTLLHYFHCAMEDWWKDGLGLSYPELMRGERLGFPAVRLEADFFEPVRYGDEPIVHLGVLRVGRASLELAFWMVREAGAPPLCRARVTTVGVDMDTLKTRPIADRWRTAFADWTIDEHEFPAPHRA